jgi:hypothetical protein
MYALLNYSFAILQWHSRILFEVSEVLQKEKESNFGVRIGNMQFFSL